MFKPSQAFMEDFLEKLMEMSFEAISEMEKMLRMAWKAWKVPRESNGVWQWMRNLQG